MTNPNEASRYVWAIQAATGQSALTGTGSQSYEFGEYSEECNKWSPPGQLNNVLTRYTYDSRIAKLTPLETELPTFKHAFHPTTCQPINWILKDYATGVDQGTGVVTLKVLETGLPNPLTIRNEENEGTAERLLQANDDYCIQLYARAMDNSPFYVECDFAWSEWKDHRTYDRLLQDPEMPAGVRTTYNGHPHVTMDYQGSGYSINCWKAEFTITQEFETTTYSEGSGQMVYLYKYQPIDLLLNGIFEQNLSWQDFADREEQDIELTIYKPDMDNYIKLLFLGCKIIDWTKTGFAHKGHYEEIAIIKAQGITGYSNMFVECEDPENHLIKGV